MRFEYLCDWPEFVNALARWHVQEWSWLDSATTEASMRDELLAQQSRSTIPTTILAIQNEQLLGSVSLLQNDHQKIRQYSPWLASLFVPPECRGRGIGKALVQRCIEEAVVLGVTRLYLYTDQHTAFYQDLGWRVVDRVPFNNFTAIVMAIDLRHETSESGNEMVEFTPSAIS